MLFNRRHFAVRHAAQKDSTRHNLNGVRVEADGTTVATDGHWLCRVELSTESDEGLHRKTETSEPSGAALEPFTMLLAGVDRLVKLLPKKVKNGQPNETVAAYLDVDATNANRVARLVTVHEVGATPEGFETEKIEGDYVNWHQVMPDKAPEVTFGLSLVLLEGLCKAVREFAPDKSRNETLNLKFEVNDDVHSPVKVTAEHDGGTLTAVLMPMRIK